MKRILLLTLTLICIAGIASAGVGKLGIYGDLAGTTCDIADSPPYVNHAFYVLHVDATSGNTSQFKVVVPAIPGVQGSFDVAPGMISLGSFTEGITITYVGCKTTFPLLIATLNWIGFGTTVGCARWGLRPDPFVVSGKVEVVDCDYTVHQIPYTLDAFFSVSGNCSCSVPTEETSWSRIKALYQ